jgi:hypothetical protein
MRRDRRIEIRVSAFEKEQLVAAAGGARELSNFLREAGLERASKLDAPESFTATIENVGEVKCPRWAHHRKGVYCGSCEQVN